MFRSPRPPFPALLVAQLTVTGVLLTLRAMGNPLDGAAVTPVACALLLLFGLPHGTLDLELLRRRDAAGPGLGVLLAAYVACAAAMYALWQLVPVLALVLFFAMAVAHFAEDWQSLGSRLLALGTATALVATPALLHRAELAAIFAALTGIASAARIADILFMIAPIAGAAALVTAGLLWRRGQHRRALALAGALVAEALLPPVVGFVIFFCFVHSPDQMRAGIRQLDRPTRDAYLWIILPLTLAAIMLAALIGAEALRMSLNAGALQASFVTLSVLTLPHMLVPTLARRYRAFVATNGLRHRPAVPVSIGKLPIGQISKR